MKLLILTILLSALLAPFVITGVKMVECSTDSECVDVCLSMCDGLDCDGCFNVLDSQEVDK